MSEAQFEAVIARAKTADRVGAKVYPLVAPRDGAGKLPVPPYAVGQPSDGVDTQEHFMGARSTAHPRVILHVVGSSYSNCQKTMEQIKGKFIDPVTKFPIPLSVPGETFRNFRFDTPLPVQVDNDVTPPLIYATAELTWDADPT